MAKFLKADADAVAECARVLASGGIIAYPTETVYGLGVDSTNRAALKKLFTAKKRDESKPASIAVANVERAKDIAIFNRVAETLALKFLPGPLTLVVRAITPIPLLSLNGKVGIRIPSNDFSQRLLRQFPNPITATSANISGFGSIAHAVDLDEKLLGSVGLVVDSDESEYAQGSTVVEVTDSGYKILREGAIGKDKLASAFE